MRILITLYFVCMLLSMAQSRTTVYLFPGQGSDERLFEYFQFDTSLYTVKHIEYPVPHKNEMLPQYAFRIAQQIDTTQPHIFIGTSLGGMICTELADVLHPQKVIVISSAKCRSELPARYRFQKYIPLNKIVPRGMIKLGARMLQPIVEPDRNTHKPTFTSMLTSKNSLYMKRTVNMIVNWNRTSYSPGIYHIHGTNDHTLPLRHVCANQVIKNGSHMMTLTRGEHINLLVQQYLAE